MARKSVPIGALIVFVVLVLIVAGKWFRASNQKHSERVETACLRNAKHLALAMRAYALDHDKRFPVSATWCDDLTPYLDTEQVLVCPLARGARASYAMNQWMSQAQVDGMGPEGGVGDQPETVVDPVTGDAVETAETVLLFDGPQGWNVAGGPGEVRYRHNDGANIGFADSHVKWVGRDHADQLRWPQIVPSAQP